jgi:hypothetical protein
MSEGKYNKLDFWTDIYIIRPSPSIL